MRKILKFLLTIAIVTFQLKGSVQYVVFSPIDELTFDQDVLIITANLDQARITLRALGYSSGNMWSSKGTPIAACSWLYVYPVISGELNFTITGFSLGTQTLKVLPQGLILISIPWNKLSMIIKNIQKMNWHSVRETITGDQHKERVDRLFSELTQKIQTKQENNPG